MPAFSPDTIIRGWDGSAIRASDGVAAGWYTTDAAGNVVIPEGDNPDIMLPGGAYVPASLVAASNGLNAPAATTTPKAPALAPATPTTTKEEKKVRDFASEARLLFPWVPDALRQVFVDAWATYGDPNVALGALRQSSAYEQFFPGNKRADGTTYLDEGQYLSTIEGYERNLRMFDQDPATYRDRFATLIQGGKSPDELAADLADVQAEILHNAPAVRQFYASMGYSADFSDAAIFASRLNPGVSPHEFEQRFRVAQIGGEATSRGFAYGASSAERLAQNGVDQNQARDLFARAQGELPTLNELMSRFDDPEDDLTLDEYSDAIVLKDAAHLQSIARVLTRAGSQFSAQDIFDVNQQGGQTGLRQR